MSDHKVFLALGSNLGNRLEMLKRTVSKLRALGLSIEAKSRVWETEPWGVTDQPLFLNMCVAARTELEPVELLTLLKSTESEMGRTAGRHWGPREIDIDIIFYDDVVFCEEKLQIPHRYMQERDFVLLPLSEIAPDMVHPLLGKSVRRLLEELEGAKSGTWISEI
ncbi:MAG: 2-amino-4-hydroxy-6-hydroxymethyldihydropteridine diphosphokinase [Cloacibacillus sp.]